MGIALYDTLRREALPLQTRDEGVVSIYVCGPTVYGDAHVGHARTMVVFDILRRYLTHQGLQVRYVCNITDVDDKIINRAQRESTSPAIVAERYTRAWNRGMDALGVLPPDVQPRATGHIIEMQELIAALVEKGHAYAKDGSVLFRVRSFPGYGRLSNRRLEDVQQGEDVAVETKDDPIDFAMWKGAKPGEPAWPSPWGPGRPGWHIECSAMADRHLGAGFDIHGGGVDLVFPHHENERAQHEAVHGEPFARYWLHGGMLRMGDEKMARSVGNIVGIEAAVARWGAGPLRLWYCGAHYRSPLTFDEARLDEASTAHERLTTFLRNARRAAAGATPDESVAAEVDATFAAALDDDINAPEALAALFAAVSTGNERLDAAEAGDAAARAALAGVADRIERLGDDVLGLQLGAVLAAEEALTARLAPLVDGLLADRDAARAAKDFAAADAIRDRLAALGVVVEDRPSGARWYLTPTRPNP